jgi:hypothetical protein
MATKQKAVAENKAVVKKRETKEELIRVKFIIPVFNTTTGTLYERNGVYFLSAKEAKQYKGDYRLC